MIRNILATIVGFIVAAGIVALTEQLGIKLFPYPEGARPTDFEWLKNNTHLIPLGSMIMVVIAHGLGVFVGMALAGFISKNSMIPAYIVAGIMIIATIINWFLIPSPIWFYIADAVTVTAGFFFGKSLAQRFVF